MKRICLFILSSALFFTVQSQVSLKFPPENLESEIEWFSPTMEELTAAGLQSDQVSYRIDELKYVMSVIKRSYWNDSLGALELRGLDYTILAGKSESEVISYSMIDGNWTPTIKQVSQSREDSSFSSNQNWEYDSDQARWFLQNKSQFYVDTSGATIYERYDYLDEQYVGIAKTQTITEGNIITVYSYEWNTNASGWEYAVKSVTETTDSGNVLQKEQYNWDNNAQDWLGELKIDYEYDDQGKLSGVFSLSLNHGDTAVIGAEEYFYDQEGRDSLVLYSFENLLEERNETYKKISYTYEVEGFSEKITYVIQEGELIASEKKIIDLDVPNYREEYENVGEDEVEWKGTSKYDPETRITYTWDDSLADWRPLRKVESDGVYADYFYYRWDVENGAYVLTSRAVFESVLDNIYGINFYQIEDLTITKENPLTLNVEDYFAYDGGGAYSMDVRSYNPNHLNAEINEGELSLSTTMDNYAKDSISFRVYDEFGILILQWDPVVEINIGAQSNQKEQALAAFPDHLLIYPNPASEIIHLSDQVMETSSTWEIINMEGKAVKRGSLESNAIEIQDLPVGQYVLKFSDAKSFRFVKQ